MCGIGGLKRFGTDPIRRDHLESLLLSLQSRGNDASGLAVANPIGHEKEGIHVFKTDDPAWEMISSSEYEKFLSEFFVPETVTVILHTRAATKGNPRDNDNNHPMFDGKTAVIHNGVIYNDDALFKELNLTRCAETDSDILRAILDKEDLTQTGIRRLSRVTGSAAIAAVTPKNPNLLLLARSGSPIVCAEVGDFLVFASEKSAIHGAMRPWVEKWGLEFQKASPNGIGWLTMPDNTAWLFDETGLSWHDEFKTCHSFTEPRRQVYAAFADRQAKWDTEKRQKLVTTPDGNRGGGPIRIKCRRDGCKRLNVLGKDQYNLDVMLLDCGHCKKPLVEKRAGA